MNVFILLQVYVTSRCEEYWGYIVHLRIVHSPFCGLTKKRWGEEFLIMFTLSLSKYTGKLILKESVEKKFSQFSPIHGH